MQPHFTQSVLQIFPSIPNMQNIFMRGKSPICVSRDICNTQQQLFIDTYRHIAIYLANSHGINIVWKCQIILYWQWKKNCDIFSWISHFTVYKITTNPLFKFGVPTITLVIYLYWTRLANSYHSVKPNFLYNLVSIINTITTSYLKHYYQYFSYKVNQIYKHKHRFEEVSVLLYNAHFFDTQHSNQTSFLRIFILITMFDYIQRALNGNSWTLSILQQDEGDNYW